MASLRKLLKCLANSGVCLLSALEVNVENLLSYFMTSTCFFGSARKWLQVLVSHFLFSFFLRYLAHFFNVLKTVIRLERKS